MTRLERLGQIAYRDRRWGWSLLFFCFALPLSLLMLQGELDRANPRSIAVAEVAVLVSLGGALTLLRSHILLIDRDAGTLLSRRMRFLWSKQRQFALADVKAVQVGMKIVDHPVSPGGSLVRSDHIYRILVDVGDRKVLIHEGLFGQSGRSLGVSLARDLRVPVRNAF